MISKSRLQILGEYFGYPQCCIDNCISRTPDNNYYMDDNQIKVDNGKGFIPCPKCAKRIVDGEIKIDDLIQNRIHPEPYPKDSIKIMNQYLKRKAS